MNYARTVWVSLSDGKFLDKKPSEKEKIPVRPFAGDLLKRGEAMQNYRPSLDPVRIAGTVVESKK